MIYAKSIYQALKRDAKIDIIFYLSNGFIRINKPAELINRI